MVFAAFENVFCIQLTLQLLIHCEHITKRETIKIHSHKTRRKVPIGFASTIAVDFRWFDFGDFGISPTNDVQ